MTLDKQDVERYQQCYDAATSGLEGYLLLEGNARRALTDGDVAILEQKAALFKEALKINPGSFPSIFFLGKIYQRLEDYQSALFYIEEAVNNHASDCNAPMEASIVAMSLDLTARAVRYSEEAVRRAPDYLNAITNHAANLFVTGNDEKALEMVAAALAIDSEDPIANMLEQMILEVKQGRRIRPTFHELIR